MQAPRDLPARRRELAALALGLSAAVVLVAAALAPFSDPELAGRAAFAQLAGQTADAVAQEWQRMLRDGELPDPGPTGSFVWDAGPSPRVLEPRQVSGDPVTSAFRTLILESRRLELESDDPEEALTVVLEALEKPAEAFEHASARLRAIQLAMRVGRGDVAREQWRAALAELDGSETCAALPCLVAAALAYAPAASEDERARIAARIAELWMEGALALPEEGLELVPQGALLLRAPSPLREALAARVDALAPRAGLAAGIARYEARRGAPLLRRHLGGALPPRPPVAGWSAEVHGDVLLAVRALPDGAVEARAMDPEELAAALSARLERYSLLPVGFRLDFDGARSTQGPAVRERIQLAGPLFGATLRHSHPDAVASAQSRRLALVRGALLVLALLCAVGGAATFRALRRERRLALLRGTFVANVSHELRTPVASILLMADNLEANRGAAAAQRYPELIRREAARLRRLVDDLLDLSRLERGRELELRREEVDLPALLGALCEEARAWGAQHRLELSVELGPDLPQSALLDGEALRRALFNLLENALRHSGSRTIGVSARAEAGELVLAVRDAGKGVHPRHRDAIFEPFERAAADGTPGAGLGLAIVRAIARGHGGGVVARDARPGPGMEFELRLPLRSAPVPAEVEA